MLAPPDAGGLIATLTPRLAPAPLHVRALHNLAPRRRCNVIFSVRRAFARRIELFRLDIIRKRVAYDVICIFARAG